MNLLFVTNANNEGYDQEVHLLHKLIGHDEKIHAESSINIEFLKKNDINVVVSSGISSENYLMLRGMKIATITFGSKPKYQGLSDITIDYKSTNKREYFAGEEFKVSKTTFESCRDIVGLISPLIWDTKYWGKKIAYLSCLHLTESIWWQVSKFCNDHQIDLVEYLCNCHDSKSVIIAEKAGFHLVDIRMTLLAKNISPIKVDSNKFDFRKAKTKDLAEIQNISSDLYIDSRYYFDENFDRIKAKNFYCEWAEKGVLGTFDDLCLCIYDNQKPVAFCTVKFDKHIKDAARIGLYGVSPSYQGNQCGKILLQNVINYLYSVSIINISVVTQARNIHAINLYESCGFKINNTQLWYHKWMQI